MLDTLHWDWNLCHYWFLWLPNKCLGETFEPRRLFSNCHSEILYHGAHFNSRFSFKIKFRVSISIWKKKIDLPQSNFGYFGVDDQLLFFASMLYFCFKLKKTSDWLLGSGG